MLLLKNQLVDPTRRTVGSSWEMERKRYSAAFGKLISERQNAVSGAIILISVMS